MEKINQGIVFSEDIGRILNGVNAFEYKYDFVPNNGVIKDLRDDFKNSTMRIFNDQVTIILEEEMERVNELIGGEYPHCIFGQNIY